MTAMVTTMTEYSDQGNTRQWALTSHTGGKPKLVVQKRTVPSNGANGVAATSIKVVFATEDADGNILNSKESFEVVHRSPVNGDSADTTAAMAVLLDIVQSTEFANTVSTSLFLK